MCLFISFCLIISVTPGHSQFKTNVKHVAWLDKKKNHGRQRKSKQNHLGSASKKSHEEKGDKTETSQPSIYGRQRETKQNHFCPSSRRAMADKKRPSDTEGDKKPEVSSAQDRVDARIEKPHRAKLFGEQNPRKDRRRSAQVNDAKPQTWWQNQRTA